MMSKVVRLMTLIVAAKIVVVAIIILIVILMVVIVEITLCASMKLLFNKCTLVHARNY